MEQQRPWTDFGHAFVAGEAALVPELEGEADEGEAPGVEEGGDGGGVDAAGHGDGDRVVGLVWHGGAEVVSAGR